MSTETIWELDLFEDDEREQLAAWNRTEAESPWGRTLVELFEEQAGARPGAEAVVCGERRVSYGELNRGANRWAHWLRGQGVGPEALVGLCLGRSVELVEGMLGVMKAGGGHGAGAGGRGDGGRAGGAGSAGGADDGGGGERGEGGEPGGVRGRRERG